MERSIKQVRSGDKKAKEEYALMEKVKVHLEQNLPIRTLEVTEEEEELIKGLFLITSKPVLYACNISEDDMMEGNTNNEYVQKVKAHAESENSEVVVVCAKLEEELSGLEDDEKQEMLNEYGLTESGLDQLIRGSYKLLGLISYLTAGVQEVRAWTIKEGTKAPQAAGKIHSDIERGFIRAEIVSYDALVECGSEAAAKEKGLYRLEGKEYVMKDGDVVNFRFNV
ncbi:Ribosome-binding ATPase YchF [bioreactor metagenome]